MEREESGPCKLYHQKVSLFWVSSLVFMFTYKAIEVYGCTYEYTYLCVYMYMCVHIDVRVYCEGGKGGAIYVNMCVCMYICGCVCMYVHMWVYGCVYICASPFSLLNM